MQTATFIVWGKSTGAISPPNYTKPFFLRSRAGRFGTKGLAITFVSSEGDQEVLKSIQSRFEVAIPELPDHIDPGTYSTSCFIPARV